MWNHKLRFFALAAFFASTFGVLLPGLGHAQQNAPLTPLTIVTFRPINLFGLRRAIKLQAEAYRRLGYEATFLSVPGKRASSMAVSGQVDGELGRPWAYGLAHPELIRVEQPSAAQQVKAFVTDPDLRLDGWESLRGTSLRVEYQRGMSSAGDNLRGVVPPERLSEVDSTEQGLKRLLVGRVDVYVDASRGTASVLQSESFRDFALKRCGGREVHVAGIMGTICLYPWLHRRHADLAPRLAEMLRTLEKDGTAERIRRELEAEVNAPVSEDAIKD